jgi:2-dehydropantoate 2-reductase
MADRPAAVTVVGAGGIGCALGHALREGGLDVTFVDSDVAKLEWGREHGVAVDEMTPHPAEFIDFERWSPCSGDLVLLCTKCYDNGAVLQRVPESVALIPVQNGFDRQLLDRGELEGIASFVSECLPGKTHTRITRPGDLHIGFRTAAAGRAIPAVSESLIGVLARHGSFSVRRVPEVLPYKYAKIMYNAAISPLASVAGLDNGELLTIARARGLFFALLRENYRILTGAGVPLARIGPFHPDTVDRLLRVPLVPRLLAFPFARTLRGSYCSMARDLPHGPTEIDNYNGHLLELAGDRDVPLNRQVYALVRRVEREGLAPGLGWLDELSAATGRSV